jgi:hypothetical protein
MIEHISDVNIARGVKRDAVGFVEHCRSRGPAIAGIPIAISACNAPPSSIE